ncbi:IS3 family transposase [Rhodococcus sp. ABRD24]|uniref:IS3 family transposase n=1 Tax=Rhodococcus sp. ABRD24 TaxID=2507582 RepID=UPI001F60FA8B|nr:IS3 family transposase [Rhodococcus sp. ABRD24]
MTVAADEQADVLGEHLKEAVRRWRRSLTPILRCPHGFRRTWAALRFDEHQGVNKKTVHRLWKEEGLQRRVHSARTRVGCPSYPTTPADAPKMVWALDFQFDSTSDGKSVKIASLLDEPPPRTSCRAVPPPGSRR